MPLRPIPNRDGLFRHVVFPNGFRSTKKRENARFDYQKLIKFYDNSDGIHGSVAWERYLPTTKHIHGYGERLASRRNQGLKNSGNFAEQKRNIYCGAYQFSAQAIRDIASNPDLSEITLAEVAHKVEEGEIAHADLRFVIDPTWQASEGTKTAIMDRLWNASSGPLRHISDCDQDLDPHPSIHLTTAPGGAYSDRRSWWVRSLWVLRFYALCLRAMLKRA